MADFQVKATGNGTNTRYYAGVEAADGTYRDWPFNFSVYNSSQSTGLVMGYMISIRASDIGPNVESDYVLVSKGMDSNTGVALHPGLNKAYNIRLELKKDLADLMAANGTRAVKAVLTVRYYHEGYKTAQAIFEDNIILSGKYSPQILAFSTLRTESNIPTDDGEDIMAKMQLSYAPETELSMMDLRLHYAEGRDATVNDEYLLLNSKITTDEISFKLDRQFSNASDWGFLLYFGDTYENVVGPSRIFEAFANMHLSGKKKGGVSFGKFSKSTDESPMFECYYPAYFYGGIVQGGGGGDYPAFGEEINTGGKWVNGKPIYRAIIETGAKTANTMKYDVSAFSIEHYISIQGMFYAQADYADGYVFPAPAAHMNNASWTIQLEAENRTTLTTGAANRTWKSGWILIEYTKAD